MQDLILIGRQGSGKGTQGKLLAEKFGYKIFVTGDELRAIAKEDSELGREVKAITERGDLVSNEIVMAIVANFIQNLEEGVQVIYDGIPRSMDLIPRPKLSSTQCVAVEKYCRPPIKSRVN